MRQKHVQNCTITGISLDICMVIEYFNVGVGVNNFRRVRDRGRQLPLGSEAVDWVEI